MIVIWSLIAPILRKRVDELNCLYFINCNLLIVVIKFSCMVDVFILLTDLLFYGL
jgi:hypothetical protein